VKAGQTKIDWWTPRGGQVDLQAEGQAADTFNKSQDKIVVQIVYVPTTAGTQMSEKLLTSIAAGTPPNTSEFDRFVVSSWAAQGALTDLTDRAKTASILAEQFYPFAWEEASYKGKLYAMPQDTDTRGIYYNMALLDKAGVKPPTNIAELDAAAEKLSIKSGRQFTQWGYSPFYNQSFHYAVCLEFAGANYDKMYDKATNKCTANAAVNVEAFTWIKSYADKYNIQDLEAFQSAFGTNTNDPFLTNQISMYAQGDWGLANIAKFKPDMKFDVVPMPGKSGAAPCMAGGWSEVVPKGAKNLDEAWAWVSWYGGPDGQLIYNKGTMHIPTNIKASQDPAFTADPKHAKFMEFLKTALNRPAIPAGQVLWNELGTAQSNVTHGVMTPQQALDVVKQKTDAELAKYP